MRKISNFSKILSIMAIMLAFFIGPMGVASANSQAHNNDSLTSGSVVSDITTNAGIWVAYDYSMITTSAKCQARLGELRSIVSWINTTNSMCSKFVGNQCPTTYYWMVMIKDQSAGLMALEDQESLLKPVTLVCG